MRTPGSLAPIERVLQSQNRPLSQGSTLKKVPRMELVHWWSNPCGTRPVAGAGAVAAAFLATAGAAAYFLLLATPAASLVYDVFRAQDELVVLRGALAHPAIMYPAMTRPSTKTVLPDWLLLFIPSKQLLDHRFRLRGRRQRFHGSHRELPLQ